VIDVGTGDGRAVMARARREPDALVIGIDASAVAMAESSRRAARPERRGGLPNALFVAAAAECPPPELHNIADEVTVLFPWGSLLRGALALDAAAAAGIASLLRPGGRIVAFVSITERDALGLQPLEAADREALARRWACHGLELQAFEPATAAQIEATGSTWARRLDAGRERPAWRLLLRRNGQLAKGQ
jgi:16S rRNA (adenine(1408)-N(1))-methyltransferase